MQSVTGWSIDIKSCCDDIYGNIHRNINEFEGKAEWEIEFTIKNNKGASYTVVLSDVVVDVKYTKGSLPVMKFNTEIKSNCMTDMLMKEYRMLDLTIDGGSIIEPYEEGVYTGPTESIESLKKLVKNKDIIMISEINNVSNSYFLDSTTSRDLLAMVFKIFGFAYGHCDLFHHP